MLTLIIAESALETVPKQLWKYQSVKKHAASRKKKPRDILLDRSYHHTAMLGMKDNEMRGRPDLIHSVLLEATSTPLFINNHLNVWIHTYNDQVIYLKKSIRLPKSYFRFEGLIEQLFREKKIVSNGQSLLELFNYDLKSLLQKIKPSQIIGLSTSGLSSNFESIATELSMTERPVIVVGGFPRNHFSESTCSVFTKIASVNNHSLEANIVVARIIYEYEKLIIK